MRSPRATTTGTMMEPREELAELAKLYILTQANNPQNTRLILAKVLEQAYQMGQQDGLRSSAMALDLIDGEMDDEGYGWS